MKNREQRHSGVRKSLLVASPNEELRTHIRANGLKESWRFEFVAGGAAALFLLEQQQYEVLLVDLTVQDIDINEIISMAVSQRPAITILVFDSQTGQFDFSKATPRDRLSPDHARLVEAISTFKQSQQIVPEAALEISPDAQGEDLLPGMVGRSAAMRRTAQLVKMIAPRSTAVLLIGESGTGKDLVAKAIHHLSPRSTRPLIVVNCAAVPEALFEAELFGYNRGAFTGAVESRLGRIHAAHGGTLFLDEVGELPLTMQAKLLRFLQEGEVQRLGSHDVFRVDVRVIAATNSDLVGLVSRHQFREDLFYRLMVFPVELDPLRKRPEDIGPLAEHFLARLSAESGAPTKTLSAGALSILQGNEWQGNVRELQHTMERAVILAHDSQIILPEHLRLLPVPRNFEQRSLKSRSARQAYSGNFFNNQEVTYN